MFDKQTGEDSPPNEQQYFTHDRRYSTSENAPRFTDEPMNMESPSTQAQSQTLANPQKEAMSLSRLHSSRHLAQAGDLHTSAGLSDASKSLHRSLSTFTSGLRLSKSLSLDGSDALVNDDFDLRDEVMSCIAKSIGLHQPPLSSTDSTAASPLFTASASNTGDRDTGFNSFGSLSLLETGDDASSVTGSSALGSSSHNLSALDNEVEILYFTAGSTLARADEHHPGMN